MDVSKAVAQRISTRGFLPDPLPLNEVRDWLTAAQRAPSGGSTTVLSSSWLPMSSGVCSLR